MRGYFGIGVLNISKPMNVGNLVRSAHAFGASFVFLVDPAVRLSDIGATDTSDAGGHMPLYVFESLAELVLPRGCRLVGVEVVADSVPLPSFSHPRRAAYLMGPELSSLDEAALARCHHVVQIPTQFCINVATSGAIVMYDRLRQHGGYPAKPVMPGGPSAAEATPHSGRRHSIDLDQVPRD